MLQPNCCFCDSEYYTLRTCGPFVGDRFTNPPSLTIVIPALNEEDAIGGTIARCLAARERIQSEAGVAHVEIVVVSDGSTDRTAEIAKSYEDVKVIVFKKNQGYGAAIKEGWRQANGSLLGFLDADGTCDPIYFAEMCRVAVEESADVVLGSRLGPESQMPGIRRLGNRIYAFLLGLFCGRQVTDTASGMRVVRRESLKWLYPLPDGLHFTPSMSARALLNDLRLIEIPIPYEERIGRSKLSVLRDGVRFLKTIFSGVLCYRPEKLLLTLFMFCLVALTLLATYPAEFYFQNRRLEEWMIYRFVVCYLLGSFGLMLLLATALTYQMASFGPRRGSANAFWPFVVASVMSGPVLVGILVGLLFLAGVFLWPGMSEYIVTGHITLHWSRLLAGVFSISCGLQTAVFALLLKVLSVWKIQHIRSDLSTPRDESASGCSMELANLPTDGAGNG
jgi:glycosyltransferase involved in cell wall biosynthesis